MTVAMQPTETTTYLKSPFIERQNREMETVIKLYQIMSTGVEHRFLSAFKVGEIFGISHSVMDAMARVYEGCGILKRRLEFGAKDDQGTFYPGRSMHWTLLLSKEEAITRLTKYQQVERDRFNHPPATKTLSLKMRVLNALEEQKFATLDALVKQIRTGSENIDYHNLTHILESLSKEGKVGFERGHTKDRIPYNIHLTKMGAKSVRVEPEIISEASMYPSEIIEAPEAIVEAPEAIVEAPSNNSEEYPLITRLIKRRAWLEEAARLAEDAYEDDLAIALLERSNKSMTPIEEEATSLFLAYRKCQEG